MNSRVIIIAILIMIKVIGVASRVKADNIDFQPWKPIYEYEILCDAKNKEKRMICKKVWVKKNRSNLTLF